MLQNPLCTYTSTKNHWYFNDILRSALLAYQQLEENVVLGLGLSYTVVQIIAKISAYMLIISADVNLWNFDGRIFSFYHELIFGYLHVRGHGKHV
jgi:hypothetical protein